MLEWTQRQRAAVVRKLGKRQLFVRFLSLPLLFQLRVRDEHFVLRVPVFAHSATWFQIIIGNSITQAKQVSVGFS